MFGFIRMVIHNEIEDYGDHDDKEGNDDQYDLRRAMMIILTISAQPVEMPLPSPCHEMAKGVQRQVYQDPKSALKMRLFCSLSP